MTMPVSLPAYSGPAGPCPSCGLPGPMTEWHRAGPLGPADMAGRRPPCADRPDLALPDGQGEHLCRTCLNCGYGWAETCADPPAPRPAPSAQSTAWAGLVVLGAGLASTGGDALLGRVLGGTALSVILLAVIVAIAVAAAAGWSALAWRGASGGADHGGAGS